MVLQNAFANLAVQSDQDPSVDASLLWATINFATSGAHTIVTPGAGQKIRLRKFLPTLGDPDGSSNPVLTLTLGGKSLRSTVLIGHFNILGVADDPLVITSSKAGQVDGTVGYTLE